MRYHAPLAVALVLALAGSAVAADLRVVRVSDGDTFTRLDAENRQIKVRLHGIDAPEAKQAFGTVARKALADLIAEKTVSVEEVDRDRYGRGWSAG
jgi:endonuclease YncB( thermonuclease family)